MRCETWIKNVGGQALTVEQLAAGARRGSDWNAPNVDFPPSYGIYLNPGESYKYSQARTFDTPGSTFVEPVAKIAGNWGGISPFPRRWINVQPGIKLVVTAPLWLSTISPRVGEWVKCDYWCRNDGAQTITLEQLTAGSRRGTDWGGANTDWPSDYAITLAPGQSRFYTHYRQFDTPGTHFAEPVVKIGGQWGGIEDGSRVWFTVR